VTSQLRRYTIHKEKMDDFVEAWTEQVVPLRRKHGFRVDGAWITNDRNEFIWILTYDGPEPWQRKVEQYLSSPERKAMNPDPSKFVAKIEEWFISPVNFG
jgi:hypothetical protein